MCLPGTPKHSNSLTKQPIAPSAQSHARQARQLQRREEVKPVHLGGSEHITEAWSGDLWRRPATRKLPLYEPTLNSGAILPEATTTPPAISSRSISTTRP